MTEEINNNINNGSSENEATSEKNVQQEQPQNVQQEQPQNVQQEQPHTSYAVRPDHRHHRRLAYSDQNNMLKVRNWLNIGFMLLAIIGVVVWTQLDDMRTLATGILILAVVLKIAEVCIRLFKK